MTIHQNTILLEANYLTLSILNDFNNKLKENYYAEKVVIDLTGVNFYDPQTILCLALILRDFKKARGIRNTLISINQTHNSIGYLAHIGFFDFIGVNFGNKIGQIKAGESFVPIRKIDKQVLLNESFETGKSLQDLIQEEAAYVARVLVGANFNKQVYLTIAYSIRETIRNALEHSERDVCYVCAQRWKNNRAQIAVVDEGIGILSSLSNAQIDVDKENFLKIALQAGLSRTLNLDEDKNIHGNSGFGLYVLQHLAKNFGRMTLSSSGKTMIIKNKKTENEERVNGFTGTCVSIEFSMYPNDIEDVISMIADSGEEEAREAGRIVKASTRSRSVNV